MNSTNQKCKPAPVSNKDRQAKFVEQHNTIVRLECENRKRRDLLEKSPTKWLKWYLAETYTRKFEKPHTDIIDGAIKADETNERFSVSAERGIGKSTILWGVVLYLNFSGKRKFPICVPWADKALKRAFRFWKNALCFNVRLCADYPEYCQPFKHSRGIAQRVPNILWADTGEMCGAQLTVGEGMIVLPDQLGVLGGSTINGNPRGLNHPQPDGSVLRPDMALIDDVQDRRVAKSPAMIRETIAVIDGDVAGCGEVGRDMPMLMANNCIEPNDVAHYYLHNTEWNALRVPCILKWPAGWNAKKSKARALWDDLHEKLLSGKGAVAFYRRHKKLMTKGMKLSAPAAFKGADKCPDAFFGVIRMYFKMGEVAFMAERQQAPMNPLEEAGPYTLTPALVMSRKTKRKRFEQPDWVTNVVASTDINPSYALSSVIIGMDEDQTAAVPWYGLHKMSIPGDTPAPQFAKMLFRELTTHGRALAALPCPPSFWAIDAGGAQFDVVIKFVEQSAALTGIPAMGFTGRGAKNYRQYGKTMVRSQRREQCHGCLDRKQGRVIRWVAWNADHWKEVEQRAWLGAIGSPGSVSLFDGPHSEFAHQVCGDKLLGKGEVGGMMLWNWARIPGKNDFGDAMAQGYAASAYMGIGTGGGVVKVKKKAGVIIRRK